MTGWKTLSAGIGAIAYGIGGVVAGLHDANTAVSYVLSGLVALGIGHKLDKQTQALKGD